METNNDKIGIYEQFSWIDNMTYGELKSLIKEEDEIKIDDSIDLSSKISADDSESIKNLLIETLNQKIGQVLSSRVIEKTQTLIKSGELRDEMKRFIEAETAATKSLYGKKKEKDPLTPEEQERVDKEMRSLGLLNERFPKSSGDSDLDGIEGLLD